MEELLLKHAGDSLFAILSVWLIITGRKDSKERESALMAVISQLNDEIIPELREIKTAIFKKTD